MHSARPVRTMASAGGCKAGFARRGSPGGWRAGLTGLALALSIAVLVGCAKLRPPGAAVVDEAMKLRARAEAARVGDFNMLWGRVRHGLDAMNRKEREDFRDRLARKLEADRNLLVKLARSETFRTLGPAYVFTSCVEKLGGVSSGGDHGGGGILGEAMTMSRGLLEEGDASLSALAEMRGHRATVVKTMLIYACLSLKPESPVEMEKSKGELFRNLQLLYPAEIPSPLDEADLKGVTLAARTGSRSSVLYVPNNGYVFGGNLTEGDEVFQGTDCSAFVSRCVSSRVRMSTLYLDLVWRTALGHEELSESEKRSRERFKKDSQFSESLEDFEALRIGDALRPGDVVTWRGITSGAGHSAIVVQTIAGSPDVFLGISALRADDQSQEGIDLSVFRLTISGFRTSILRPRA